MEEEGSSYFAAANYLNYSIKTAKSGKRHEVILGIREALKVIRNCFDETKDTQKPLVSGNILSDVNKELKEQVISMLSRIEAQPENILDLNSAANRLFAVVSVLNLMQRNVNFGLIGKK